ncbi:MAG TPA: 2-C-methyl-D-erythritol 4-phosphate cytidylyltransferase [Thermoanaerobaculia bacterium]|nr:2-C-methyl-D-erythritol 4-phosphate cytidylyltransferase [Thermoanaerobaculia bacterium]
MARILVIVPAAGLGTRFGSDIPKQFQPLAGKPILQHVVERFLFHEDVARVVVAVTEQLLTVVAQSAGDRVHFVAGGETRQQSVANALRAAGDQYDLVAIHDAVRPFFADSTFRAVVDAAQEFGAALPAVPVRDTIHETRDDFIDLTLDRSTLVLAQTPQCFRFDVLRDILDRASREGDEGTDEAGLAARYGVKVRVVPGDSINFKITRPDDLAMAEAIYARFGQS